ncbi:MAG: glycoside hydrolase family 2 TIM barrel-domain containing protein [Fusicatenibacter sp.]|nr:glycoside hydrolase family 2 TIM barrel-domain containing protein [Lachnospiraceae bacterium]MDY2938822.1 glycoside hydrolase family 2 TIM barrel-domain containing protein [Fusicatenibacter sp.]
MIRTFCTNRIRKTEELSDSLWKFSPCAGEHSGQVYQVSVPTCWESIPDFAAYRGEGVFTREFQAGGTIRLVFQGVSHTARICVDGREAGRHYNAYTPFSCVVKGLQEGIHTLEVYADNSFSEKSALHVPNDYMSYGGISRGVVLEQLKGAYIEYVHAVPLREDSVWKADLKVKVNSVSEEDCCYRLNIRLETGEEVVEEFSLKAGEEKILSHRILAGQVEPWCIENPKLYTVNAVLLDETGAVDDLTERMGFREIKTEGKDLLLNGKKLRIKGFCRHEDHPMFGCALPYSAICQDLMIMRDLGANAVRTSHYPNDQLFLDLCDEMGILVWEENHARGLSLEQMQNPYFEEQAETCIVEMITAHINHPCILIWGILNECASDTPYGYECYKKQYELIKEMDTSRPRSSASCKFKTDLCFGLPEIVSYNLYPEWYHDESAKDYVKEIYEWVQNESEGRNKPFLVTEIGAGAIYGYRTPTMCKWSEEYQAKALEDQMMAVLEQEGCSGVFLWQFCDVRISPEWFSNRPRTMNNKGIVDEYRRRKLSYDVVKRIFHSYPDYR